MRELIQRFERAQAAQARLESAFAGLTDRLIDSCMDRADGYPQRATPTEVQEEASEVGSEAPAEVAGGAGTGREAA